MPRAALSSSHYCVHAQSEQRPRFPSPAKGGPTSASYDAAEGRGVRHRGHLCDIRVYGLLQAGAAASQQPVAHHATSAANLAAAQRGAVHQLLLAGLGGGISPVVSGLRFDSGLCGLLRGLSAGHGRGHMELRAAGGVRLRLPDSDVTMYVHIHALVINIHIRQ